MQEEFSNSSKGDVGEEEGGHGDSLAPGLVALEGKGGNVTLTRHTAPGIPDRPTMWETILFSSPVSPPVLSMAPKVLCIPRGLCPRLRSIAFRLCVYVCVCLVGGAAGLKSLKSTWVVWGQRLTASMRLEQPPHTMLHCGMGLVDEWVGFKWYCSRGMDLVVRRARYCGVAMVIDSCLVGVGIRVCVCGECWGCCRPICRVDG